MLNNKIRFLKFQLICTLILFTYIFILSENKIFGFAENLELKKATETEILKNKDAQVQTISSQNKTSESSCNLEVEKTTKAEILNPKNRIFGFSGGPGIGKTTTTERLKNIGIQVRPEAFTTFYIQAEKEKRLDTFFKDMSKLYKDLMDYQVQGEDNRDKSKSIFLDTTALDIIFFGNIWNVNMSEDLYNIAENRKYDLIFFFKPLPKKFYQTSNVRKKTYEQALKTHNFLRKKYHDTGLDVIYVPFETPENRVDFILNTIKKQYEYIEIISNVIDCFSGKSKIYPIQNFLDPIKLIEIPSSDPKNPYRFFGVHQDQQKNVNFYAFKKKLTDLIKIKKTNSLQIIGDSNQFSKSGTKWARQFIKKQLLKAGLITYGFTGYKTAYKVDTNTLINDYAKENSKQAYKIVANIVGQTSSALNQWGASGSPLIRNFVLVYNNSGISETPKFNEKFEKINGFTTFGDDMIISDYLFNSTDNDKFICLEGGVQSFQQAINALILDIPIICVYNLRKPENEKFFSTARFFNLINNAYIENNKLTKKIVKEIYNNYVNQLINLWNPKKPDHETKKVIFDKAIKEFFDKNLYKKIPKLCNFKNAKLQ